MMARFLEPLLIPCTALCVALALFGVFIAIEGHDPFAVYASIYRGAFGSAFSWQNTLVRAAPLMLTALCTALPARLGLVVIGGEGAVVVGGLTAALVGITLSTASAYVAIPAMMLMSMLAGGAWIAAAGVLKQYRGVNETISSLLLNYIAIAVLSFLVVGPLKDPATLNKPSTYPIGDANMLGMIGDSAIHWGLLFGVLICLGLAFVMRYTTYGFSLDVAGDNPRAALLTGLPVGKLVVSACFIGGAAAGLAGMIEVAAVHGRANTSLNAGYGYAGILVAFIARQNPLAIIPVAILLGGIRASSGVLQRSHDLPDATALVLQGIILLVILASEAWYGRWAIFKRREQPA